MVNFMLDYLRRKSRKSFNASLEISGLPAHLDFLITFCFANTRKGETALFCFKRFGLLYYFRVKHFLGFAVVVKYDNPLKGAYHICRHTYAFFRIGIKSVNKVIGNRDILRQGGKRLSAEEKFIVYYRFNHSCFFFRFSFILPNAAVFDKRQEKTA